MEFPKELKCFLENGYKNTANARAYLGKRGALVNQLIDVTIFVKTHEEMKLLYDFYTAITNYTANSFLIDLPVFGTDGHWLVQFASPLTWENIKGSSGEVKCTFKLVHDTPVYKYNADITADGSYTISVTSYDTLGRLFVTDNDGNVTEYDVPPNETTDITLDGDISIDGYNIATLVFNSNSAVKTVDICADGIVDASHMFEDNDALEEVISLCLKDAVDISHIFDDCGNLLYVDEAYLPNVITMDYAFYMSTKLRVIKNFNAPRVESGKYAFSRGDSLVEITGSTFENIIDGYYMFGECPVLRTASFIDGDGNISFPNLKYGQFMFYYTLHDDLGTIDLPELLDGYKMLLGSKADTIERIYAPKLNDAGNFLQHSSLTAIGEVYAPLVGKALYMFADMDNLTHIGVQLGSPTNCFALFKSCDDLECITGSFSTKDSSDNGKIFEDCDNLVHPNESEQNALESDDGADYSNSSCD